MLARLHMPLGAKLAGCLLSGLCTSVIHASTKRPGCPRPTNQTIEADQTQYLRRLFASAQRLWADEIPAYSRASLEFGGERAGPYWSGLRVEGIGLIESTVYIPPSFITGRRSWELEHAVLHELAHHVQALLGIYVDSKALGPRAPGTQHELAADCLSGWTAGTLELSFFSQEDMKEAAEEIGDDRLGARPGEYTHGSAAARRAAVERGLDSKGKGGWRTCLRETFGPWAN